MTLLIVDLHIIGSQLYRFAGELRIKMLQVVFRFHIRLVRRNDLFGVEQRPVDSFEERMRLNVSETSLRMTTQSLFRVLITIDNTLHSIDAEDDFSIFFS